MILAEYIWLDEEQVMRSKTKMIPIPINQKFELNSSNFRQIFPMWKYDSNSNSSIQKEILLKPCSVYKDPFRMHLDNENTKAFLILCEIYIRNDTPHQNNSRSKALKRFKENPDFDPFFCLKQDFFISRGGNPIGINDNTLATCNPKYGVGSDDIYGRALVEEGLFHFIYAGLNVIGYNSQEAPSKWRYKVYGKSIDVCDQLIILRYILSRILENSGYTMDLKQKEIEQNKEWGKTKCVVTISTLAMRERDGINAIEEAADKLRCNHKIHMKNYGYCEPYENFNEKSIKIPYIVSKNKMGYLEDLRPQANCDPYNVTSLIFETISKPKENMFEETSFIPPHISPSSISDTFSDLKGILKKKENLNEDKPECEEVYTEPEPEPESNTESNENN